MENKAFTDKNDRYYNMDKVRFVQFIREGPNKILDLGCASGKLGRELRGLNKASEIVGAEIFEQAALEAAKYYDKVYLGDIEQIGLDYKDYFDYVICGDILEHLRDPWTMLNKIFDWLKKDAIFISSIPNIRYWRILKDLIILGKWDYTEAGILDKTHLRFFTKRTYIEMIITSKFTITYNEMWLNSKKKRFLNRCTLGIFEELLGSQIMVVAKK
jgi:2-polyprenyl-3-methyl-5-hydroxy-6-metoxy-1,4-benzoquinol methylase